MKIKGKNGNLKRVSPLITNVSSKEPTMTINNGRNVCFQFLLIHVINKDRTKHRINE